MQASPIFYPMIGMMILTFVVWIYMYFLRLSWIKKNNPDPQDLSTPEKGAQVLPEAVNLPSNNLKNLFELPVIFYAICIYLGVSNGVDSLQLILAYGFLLLRTLHSTVQCTINKVLLRFALYALSSFCLWAMVLIASFRLFTTG